MNIVLKVILTLIMFFCFASFAVLLFLIFMATTNGVTP